jgi:Ca-activated chloride channel family protein
MDNYVQLAPSPSNLGIPAANPKLLTNSSLPPANPNYINISSIDTPRGVPPLRRSHPYRALGLAVVACILTTASPAQIRTSTAPAGASSASDPTPTIKVDSRIVAVSAVARDKSGKPVADLTRSSFVLKQDGKPQTITYFSQGSELPLTLALMVDTSGSQRAYIHDEIAAGKSFFPAMMSRPDDRAVLVQFDSTVLQLAHITSNVTTLEHALAYLTQSHDDIAAPARNGGGTLLFDAICDVSRLELGTQLGRRAMVILTDGGDNGSHSNAKNAIRAAQAADISIYTVYYSDGGGDEGVLKNLSRQTGGREFSVGGESTLAQIYAAIAADLRLEYEIGYRPPDSKPGIYHKIDLTPTAKDLTVQAREGYFTPVPK